MSAMSTTGLFDDDDERLARLAVDAERRPDDVALFALAFDWDILSSYAVVRGDIAGYSLGG